MDTDEKIQESKKIYSIDELKNLGYSHYKINKFVQEGKLVKLNKKFYENVQYTGDENDFYYAKAYVSSGVICLLSAAVHYNLSNYRPDGIDVAIHRSKKITTLPDWPVLNLYYFDEVRYETGRVTEKFGDNYFDIYDIEKTVIDIIYYRNKIGIEETKEILTSYLKRGDRDINKLYKYAKLLKCHEILQTYLEVLV